MFIKLLNHTQQKWYTCIYNLSLWIKICLTVYKGPQQSGRGRDGIRGKSPRGESEEWSCLLKTCWGDFSSCFVVNCFPHNPFFHLYIFHMEMFWDECTYTHIAVLQLPSFLKILQERENLNSTWILTQVWSSRSYDKCVQCTQKNVKCQIRI